MSMQALGWLGKSLGVNISGRSTDTSNDKPLGQVTVDEAPSNPQDTVYRQHTLGTDTAQPTITQLMGGVMNTIGNAVFGSASSSDVGHTGLASFGNDDQCASSFNQPKSQEMKPTHVDDTVDFDENGLPKTRNWYRYDESEKKWIVTDDAPEDVRKEYEEKQRERENERLGIKKVIGPPPPPGQTISSAMSPNMGTIGSLQYADNNFFNTGGASQPALVPSDSTGSASSPPQIQDVHNSHIAYSSPNQGMPSMGFNAPAGSQYQHMTSSPVQPPYSIHTPHIIAASPPATEATPSSYVPMVPGIPSPAAPPGYSTMALPFKTGGLAFTPAIDSPQPPVPSFQPLQTTSAGPPPPSFPKPPSFPVPPY
eukprot:Tbor_TRINITY_DN4773_c0_g3::TRINITY_DN4773_c0_g3_i1::g.17040::m.17040